MNRSQRIKNIVNLTNIHEQKIAQRFMQKQKVLATFEHRLNILRSYRQEYLDQIKDKKNDSLSAIWLQEQQLFLSQIDYGITLLVEQIKEQKELNILEWEQWVKAKRKKDAMEGVWQKIAAVERRIQEDRLQDELDDIALSHVE